MSDEIITNTPSFFGKIDRTHWNLHLNSHSLFIRELKNFFESIDLPLLVDRFMGIIRWKCFTHAGAKFEIEELQINFSTPDRFQIKIVFANLEQKFSQNYSLTRSQILAYSISNDSLLITQRLKLGLLLPSDEPEIIEILNDSDVWKMRGQTYSPLENIYSVYPSEKEQFPWYKYYFVVRLSQNKRVIGFIGFSQISQPSLITPSINQHPYLSVMLSYGLSKHYWGKGLMWEAVSACVPWFVKNQNIAELIAFAEVKNQASHKILQNLGLQECGVLENTMTSSNLKDICQFTIYKS